MLSLIVLSVLLRLEPASPEGPIYPSASTSSGASNAFEFAPSTAAGLPSASNLCDALPSADFTGDTKWCLNGDGTTVATGLSFSPVNSPTTQTRSVCPNGSSCANVSGTLFNGTSHYMQSALVASPAGDFSVCVLGRSDDLAVSGRDWVTKDGLTRGFMLRQAGPTQTQSWVFKSNGSSTIVTQSPGGQTPRAHHLHCFTYDFVADGTSIGTSYVDGVATTTPSSTSVGPLQAATSRWYVATNGNSPGTNTYDFKGLIRGAFMTEKVLSPTSVAALARAVLADSPKGSKGESITITRASASSCPLDLNESELTFLPSGRPCINSFGLAGFGPSTNLCLRSEELGNAAWTDSGTPTVTSDSTLSPDGTTSADTLTDDDGAALEGRCQTIATTTLSKQTFSIWLKGGTATDARLTLTGTGNSAGDVTCDYSGLSTSAWARKSCASASTYAAGLTAVTVCAFVGDAVADQGTLFVWGAQHEANSASVAYVAATPYIPTAGSSVSRLDSVAKLTGGSFPVAPSSIAATLTVIRQAININNRGWHVSNSASTSSAETYFAGASQPHCQYNDGASSYDKAHTASITLGASERHACAYDGALITNCLAGVCQTGAAVFTQVNRTQLDLGGWFIGSYNVGGYLKEFCISSRALGCR